MVSDLDNSFIREVAYDSEKCKTFVDEFQKASISFDIDIKTMKNLEIGEM